MSSFTLGVAILGGLILAILVGWNAWTARRQAPRQPTLEDRKEPGEPAAPVEPSFDPEDTPLPMPERKPGLDALIDVLAPIAVESTVSGDAAVAALPTTRRAGSKPFAIEGLNEATQHWETPQAGQRYGAFQAGVQMANRTGALNEIEYS